MKNGTHTPNQMLPLMAERCVEVQRGYGCFVVCHGYGIWQNILAEALHAHRDVPSENIALNFCKPAPPPVGPLSPLRFKVKDNPSIK